MRRNLLNQMGGSPVGTKGFGANTGGISGPFVQLQAATPGTAQVGNFNVSGRGIVPIVVSGNIRPAADGVTAVQITSAFGVPVINCDTSSRKVEIGEYGTGAPIANLVVVNDPTDVTNMRGIVNQSSTGNDYGARVNLLKSRGGPHTQTICLTGDVIGRVMYKAWDGVDWQDSICIRGELVGTVAASRVPSDLVFYTSSDTAPSVYRETLRLTENGDLKMLLNKSFFVSDIRANASGDDALEFKDSNGLTKVHFDFNPTSGYWNVRFDTSFNSFNGTVVAEASGQASFQTRSDASGSISSRKRDDSITKPLYISAESIQFDTGAGAFTSATPMYADATGVAFGVATAPSARVMIAAAAGTGAGTAPLKLVNGGLTLATPEAGAMETDGDKLYYTGITGPTRKIVQMAKAVEDTGAGPLTLDLSYETVVKNQANANTINLPAATGSGKIYIIKNIGAGAVTVDGSGAETIDGSATVVLAQWDSITVQDYKSGLWVII